MSDLETACPECNSNSDSVTGGSGLFTKNFDLAASRAQCGTCRGIGTVPTEKGSDLLDFLKRHGEQFVSKL